MTDTAAKEDVRTRWGPDELKAVAQQMVVLQRKDPKLGDLEAVRLAQSVIDKTRQREIKQWQNVKRLDPLLAVFRAAPSPDVMLSPECPAPSIESPALALDNVPVPAPETSVVEAAQPDAVPSAENRLFHANDAPAPSKAFENGNKDSAVFSEFVPTPEPSTEIGAAPAPSKAFEDDDKDDIAFYGFGPDTDVEVDMAAFENPRSLENAGANQVAPFAFDDRASASVIDLDNNETDAPSISAADAFEHEEVAPGLAPVVDFEDVIEPVAEVAAPADKKETALALPSAHGQTKASPALPTVDGIRTALTLALGALASTQSIENVLANVDVDTALDALSQALGKAFSDEHDGVLGQDGGEGLDPDAKIFVAGFAGNEQKAIENALSRFDVRVWKPSQGVQMFESMAKACTVAVIPESMGEEVDDMLRSLKIKVLHHEGSTSRLAERIAEMA